MRQSIFLANFKGFRKKHICRKTLKKLIPIQDFHSASFTRIEWNISIVTLIKLPDAEFAFKSAIPSQTAMF